MFCPVCKAEYRPGFTKCSDCGVELVSELPVDGPSSSYSVLWKGEDAILHDSLLDELERAGIGCADTPLHVYLRNQPILYGPVLGPHFGFVVSVHTQDLPAARAVLEKLLDIEPEVLAEGAQAQTQGDPQTFVTELPLDWDASMATVELVSRESEERTTFLEDSLHGIGIPTRRDTSRDDVLRLLVRPEDEERAKSILNQIKEQAAPAEDLPAPKPSIWEDEPVRSYALLYYLLVPYLGSALLMLGTDFREKYESPMVFVTMIVLLASAIAQIGSYWMMYQAIRYEIRPLWFFLLAFLPLSFIWYYFERYTNRRGPSRLPIAVRARMHPPQT